MAREFFLEWEHRGTRWETPRDPEVGHRETRDEQTRGGGGEERQRTQMETDGSVESDCVGLVEKERDETGREQT